MANVAIIGTGYVGLTTAACLAYLGHNVVGVDVDPAKVEALRAGRIPIYEPGLDGLVAAGMAANRLDFRLGIEALTDEPVDVAFVCVPTPPAADGSADLSYVERAAQQLSTVLPSGAVVVCKSTVPVGSDQLVRRGLNREDLHVASNPEFLREGSAVNDFLSPDRVVVGADTPEVSGRVAALYSGLRQPIVQTDIVSAQLIKYAANVFLAMKLSFVNELATACEVLGGDINAVTHGMGLDGRIGSAFLQPGPGWGGSCFPKDTLAMVHAMEAVGGSFSMVSAAVESNDRQFDRTADKVRAAVGGSLAGRRVAVWGLTFKANTDDRRDSPAFAVIERLIADGATVTAFDPMVRDDVPSIDVVSDAVVAATGADVLVVLTEWPMFASVSLAEVHKVMAVPAIVDARNLLDANEARALGFSYVGIGGR
jgi:UDPglucose 6-dehydrogenase